MAANALTDITWYRDEQSAAAGEPGITHSFAACLASALHYRGVHIDPAALMGATGFAFRIHICETFCPSAMSVFDWNAVLPVSVEQMGFGCESVTRSWDEGVVEAERKAQAHAAIVAGIDAGRPAVVWDVADCEWGLITGYDDDAQAYAGLGNKGLAVALPYERLGQNGVNILSVTLPTEKNGKDYTEILESALRTAVAHADQREWSNRPQYQNGQAAFDLWAKLFERGALLFGAGKGENVPSEIWDHALYYAEHHYSARRYARDFLDAAADGDGPLRAAAAAYGEVAAALRPVWEFFAEGRERNAEEMNRLAETIREADAADARGIGAIREYLASLPV